MILFREERRRGSAENPAWTSSDVVLPSLAVSAMTGTLHMWIERPPRVMRRSLVAATGAFMASLIVGCYVNIARDIREMDNLQPPPSRDGRWSWNDDEKRSAYIDDLPRGQRSLRTDMNIKDVHEEDA
ncbi:uncharacterized protein LOC144173190 [Haemaphysalis longicornis]